MPALSIANLTRSETMRAPVQPHGRKISAPSVFAGSTLSPATEVVPLGGEAPCDTRLLPDVLVRHGPPSVSHRETPSAALV